MQQHDHGVFGDLWNHPFSSRRSATVAMRGMVATSQSLAAQAGLSVLERGGNAVDAAIATAAALTVVEPTSNGLGSDAFALVWDGQQVHGLNGSGRWPQAADLSAITPDAHGAFPSRGWQPVTVPGAIDAWGALHDRFGVLDRAEVLAPAIALAVQGHPVSPVAAVFWAKAASFYPTLGLPGTQEWSTVFAPNGRAPRPGERWVAPGHGRTLRAIADNGWRDAYEGSVARAIVEWSERTGGWLSEGDLATTRPSGWTRSPPDIGTWTSGRFHRMVKALLLSWRWRCTTRRLLRPRRAVQVRVTACRPQSSGTIRSRR